MTSQLKEAYKTGLAMRTTPVVDDDFPEMRHKFDRALRRVRDLPEMPPVVCLCGSTRFKEEFIDANFRLTKQGKIVLTVGWFSHSDDTRAPPTRAEKIKLDDLHKRKIDLADEVFVVNPGGYIGDSTRSEVEYAVQTCKPVSYLCPPAHSETPA